MNYYIYIVMLVIIELQVWIDVKSGGCMLVSLVLLEGCFCKNGLLTLELFWLQILSSSSEVVVFGLFVLLFCFLFFCWFYVLNLISYLK